MCRLVLTFTYDGYGSSYAQITTKIVIDSRNEVPETDEKNNVVRVAIEVLRQ